MQDRRRGRGLGGGFPLQTRGYVIHPPTCVNTSRQAAGGTVEAWTALEKKGKESADSVAFDCSQNGNELIQDTKWV